MRQLNAYAGSQAKNWLPAEATSPRIGNSRTTGIGIGSFPLFSLRRRNDPILNSIAFMLGKTLAFAFSQLLEFLLAHSVKHLQRRAFQL